MSYNLISCICSYKDIDKVHDFLDDIYSRSSLSIRISDTEDSVISSDVILYVHSANCLNDETVSSFLRIAYNVNKTFIPFILGGNAITNSYLRGRYDGPNLRTDFIFLNNKENLNEFYSRLYSITGKELIGDAYGIDVIFDVDLDCKVFKNGTTVAELKADSDVSQYIRCFPTAETLRFQSIRYPELSIEKKFNFKKPKNDSILNIIIADIRTVDDYKLSDGYYSGAFFLESREGEGTCKFFDRSSYSGMWKNDKMNGKGTFTFPDGREYYGVWSDNILISLKSYSWKDLGKYDGETRGTIEGYGHSEWKKNDWIDGMRHGNGKYIFPNGDVYEGNWENDKFQGEGKMLYANGDVYEGSWDKGYMSGIGKYMCKLDKWTYTGEMKYDHPEGIGEKLWRNKDKYEGHFRRGYQDGKGIMYYGDGSMYDGKWRNNQKEGQGKQIWRNGDTYEGFWRNGLRHGDGTMIWKHKGSYVGQWQNDHMQGVGERNWRNGKKYEGEWRFSQRHGKGILFNSKGEIEFDGCWEEDKRMNWIRRLLT